jgi:hypothetical protein
LRTGCWRGTFSSKTGEVARDWRKLHNGDLCNFYSSPDFTKRKNAVFHMGHYVVWWKCNEVSEGFVASIITVEG